MPINPFENQLERLARTLTEQFGVNVTCQGDNAWTDGKQIVLPSLPEPLSESLERMMVGYLDHEMGHVAFSEFKVAEEFMNKHPGSHAILNTVEDALIERKAMQRWPGVRANLDAMFAQIHDRLVQLMAQRGPFDRFCTAVYLRLAHYNNMMGLDHEIIGYEDLLDGFAAVKDTRDAADLAEALLNRWVKNNPQHARSSRQAEGQNSNPSNSAGSANANQPSGSSSETPTSSAGKQHDNSPASTEGTSGQPSNQQPQEDPANSQDASAEDSSHKESARKGHKRRHRNKSADPTAEKNPSSDNVHVISHNSGSLITQALTEAIAESVSQVSNSTDYRVFTKQHDRIDALPSTNDAEVHALLQKGVDVVRRLRRGLANALRSAEKRWWKDDQTRGVLSPRTLYRLSTDRTQLDVFRVRSMVQGRSTAVCVVLDASGSMTSNKMNVARQSMRVLLGALSDLKIATEAFTFTTGDKFSLADACKITGQDYTELQSRFSRFGNLEIGLIKRYEEPVKFALARLPAIHGTGLTPLGEAMQIGASRIMGRREHRKIMLVLTDGRAGCECGDGAAVIHARHVSELCQKAGIELVGVGILDESLREIVADTIVIHQLDDLPIQLCKLLGRTLRKGLRHVG